MTRDNGPVLPLDFNIPRGVSEVTGTDGKTYLQFATHMVTFYKQTYGEHSRFFMALRDCRLIGSRCPECGQVMVPAATWHCANCNFVEMEEVELPHRGVLAATAPITIFPSASFIGQAPFARGYVDVATDAPIASFMPARLQTTTGLPRPGIFVKGVALKLVFEDDREGRITDVFWVPVSELTGEQLAKVPLMASDLDFASPPMPAVTTSEAAAAVLTEAIGAMARMGAQVPQSRRASQDVAGRTHTIGVRTGGGDFGFYMAEGTLRVEAGMPADPEFVMATEDPQIFLDWVRDGSLTDAVVEGVLWLPHRDAFSILPILDRLPRSIRRDLRDR